jgi:serine/threonine-protein kinase
VIGRELGAWRVEALLGRGGMGAVYRASDRSGASVALKVMAARDQLEARARERFEQEAALLASLRHPNVVAVVGGLASDGEHAFYAMELVLGRSLAAVIAERGRLEPGAAVAVMLEVLAGLEAAHTAGIVHRDVKPSNVLIDKTGRVKVVDFGLARVLDATRLTVSGQTLGTPAYMSPEQANALPADARSDVYAAGVVLFELLTGKPPFVADSPLAVLRQHVEARVPALSPEIAPELAAFVARSLAKDPAARFADASEQRRALEALGVARRETLVELAGAAETTALPPTPTPAPKRSPRALVLVLVLVLGFLGVALLRPSGREVSLETTDGDTLRGALVTIDREGAHLRLGDGTERMVPRDRIARLVYR